MILHSYKRIDALVVELKGGHGKRDLGGRIRREVEIVALRLEGQIAEHGGDVDDLLLRRLLDEGEESDGEEDGANDVNLVLDSETGPV